jgi:hypothetical protein
MSMTNKTFSKIKTKFPNAKIFYSLSEEELLPNATESFSKSGLSMLTNISNGISSNLGTLNTTALNEFKTYGFYSVYNLAGTTAATTSLSSVILLSLNTMACNSYNMGLMSEKTDPGN